MLIRSRLHLHALRECFSYKLKEMRIIHAAYTLHTFVPESKAVHTRMMTAATGLLALGSCIPLESGICHCSVWVCCCTAGFTYERSAIMQACAQPLLQRPAEPPDCWCLHAACLHIARSVWLPCGLQAARCDAQRNPNPGRGDRLAVRAQWLQLGHVTSPMTNQPLPHPGLTPNRALKSAIMQWRGR